MNRHVLIIDGMNFLHRARSGFAMGPAPVVYNFMRNFRAIVEQFAPDYIYFVLEGHPQQRIDALPQYKANRQVEADSAAHEEQKKFFKQVDHIIELLGVSFPVRVVRHPELECDDVIYDLVSDPTWIIDDSYPDPYELKYTVVSNDSDFTQLLCEFDNVSVYNPMLKKYVEKPDYDYVTWKALRGDGSDNIPGIPGIGDVTATKAMDDPELLREILSRNGAAEIFQRNVNLIKFITIKDTEKGKVEHLGVMWNTHKSWEPLRQAFEKYGFQSLLKPEAWQKYIGTFHHQLHVA